MQARKFQILILVILLASVYTGCSSSSLTNVWRDPAFKSTPMKNVLVIAAKKNPVNRRMWEDEIVAELSNQNVTATPSYRMFEDSIPDPNQVGIAVQMKKFDGVLLIRKLASEISTNYVPGTSKSVQITQYNERTQTYSSFYKDVEEPGYTDTNKVVRHEINFFSTEKEGGHLIWSGTGEMLNPSSRDEVRHEISALVIPELANEGIIPSK